MIEDSSLYNFSKSVPDENSDEEIVRSLRKDERIPELPGVKVYVAGARNLDVEKGIAIREFWKRYFAETGAELVDYGPELLRFREH